jgi:hypothetical protein
MIAKTLPEILAEYYREPTESRSGNGVSRRGVIAGLVSAPFVIRMAGILMPGPLQIHPS